ncbi:hypothetical protein [Rugamonas fusca]|nr:hypothetical protein [Rugamonas fusca]
MNIALGIKIIAVLTLVVASTAAIVQMEQLAAAQNSAQLHKR